jgi:hypothetical protein
MNRRLAAVFSFLVLWALAVSGCRDKSSTTSNGTGSGNNVEPDPRVELPAQKKVDLGEVDFGDEKKHTFEVLNRGGSPLTWKLATKNCSCFDIDMKPADGIPARSKGEVTLRWTPRVGEYDRKTLEVVLETNDPNNRKITLGMFGQVTPKVRVDPKDQSWIEFDKIEPGRIQQRTLTVYSTELDKFDLKASISHPGLTVKTESLGAGIPVDDVTAKAAYRVIVATTNKPPQGSFSEKLSLAIRSKGENRVIQIPVYGESQSGSYSLAPEVLEFSKPRISDGDSKKVSLSLLKAGPNDKVEVVERQPAFLGVDCKKVGPNWHITVTLPKDNPEAAAHQADKYLQGRVILKTTVPGVPRVQFRVVWIPPDSE